MKRVLFYLSLYLLSASIGVAQPTITGLSSTTLPRSNRLLIHGSGFGFTQGSGHVEISTLNAQLTRWTNTLIVAYVPEGAAVGTGSVKVVASNGASSNPVELNVTLRPGPKGRVRWRFPADADYIYSRPAVGADGTVYTIDIGGHLYALTANGGLKWISNLSGYGFGNVSLGADGTIYVGSSTTILALNPNGKVRWQFKQNPAAFIFLGPNVGPDGNIYAVGAQGMGVFSLTPNGTLRWSIPESYDRPIVQLQEIVFGPISQSRLYFHANNHLRSVGLDGSQIFTVPGSPDTLQADPQPAISADGNLYANTFSAFGTGLALGALDTNGSQRWSVFDQSGDSTNVLSTPEVGPDGVIYDGRNLLQLYAINPDGTVKWLHKDTGILYGPVVSPLNDVIFVPGIVTYGRPGFFEGIDISGAPLWKILLPSENGGHVWPMSRARFAPDGRTAYEGTSIPGQPSENAYCYLYSIRIN